MRGYVISFTCVLCRAPDREGGVVVAVHGEEINPDTTKKRAGTETGTDRAWPHKIVLADVTASSAR